jgi:hypothetical protein
LEPQKSTTFRARAPNGVPEHAVRPVGAGGAGVPLGEVARRLGRSVETLVGTYVGALDGDDTAANELIDSALGPSRAWIADIGSATPVSPPAPLPRTMARPGE